MQPEEARATMRIATEAVRLMTKKKQSRKKQELLTRKELAANLKCHVQTISKWEAEGMPIAKRGRGGSPSQFDLEACRQWRDARLKESQSNDPRTDLAKERARKESAQAALAEQMHAVRAKTLIPREQAVAEGRSYIGRVMAKLRSLPSRAVQEGSIPPESRLKIEALIEEAIVEMSSWKASTEVGAA